MWLRKYKVFELLEPHIMALFCFVAAPVFLIYRLILSFLGVELWHYDE